MIAPRSLVDEIMDKPKPLTVSFVTFINGKIEVVERRELKPDPTIVVRRQQREGI